MVSEERLEIKRDGITLRGHLLRPNTEKSPIAIMYHGFTGTCGIDDRDHTFSKLANKLLDRGIAVIKFDFNGHGISDGSITDMNIFNEINDAIKILEYTQELDFVTDIYIIGHSMGCVVGGMVAGYYREAIKKLVMLAPAATMKDDTEVGECFGTVYDKENIPKVLTVCGEKIGGHLFRIIKTLPIYETTSRFKGKTLIIHGTEDEAVRVIGAKRYLDCMENAELKVYEGENHQLNKYAQEEILTLAADFLAE